jgi:hypothetical protein
MDLVRQAMGLKYYEKRETWNVKKWKVEKLKRKM